MLFRSVNLLVGVILRYFVGAITDWLDVDPVPFTWVEEVGELSLAWLTLIGAAIGIESRISTAKTMATVASSMKGPSQCWGSPCGNGEIMVAKP